MFLVVLVSLPWSKVDGWVGVGQCIESERMGSDKECNTTFKHLFIYKSCLCTLCAQNSPVGPTWLEL